MRNKKLILAAVVLLPVFTLTGCSTTAFSNTESYFGQLSSILEIAMAKEDQTPEETSNTGDTVQKTALETPGDFQISEDGAYSFSDVEHAESYLIFLCDPSAVNDSDDYLYASTPIVDNDSSEYTGNLNDIVRFPYGEYLVKVVAYPEKSADDMQLSSAAKADYTYKGEMSQPVVDYFWDASLGEMYCLLTNIEDYTYEAYPDALTLTFTNTEDPADTVTQTLDEISPDTVGLTISGLSGGQTYQIDASVSSASEYVTNKEADPVVVEDGLTLDNINIISAGYSYSDGIISLPRLIEAFDENGGFFCNIDLFGTPGEISTEAPTNESDGRNYHFEYSVSFLSGSGDIRLKEDGTLTIDMVNLDPMGTSETTTSGTWIDQGDGTLLLNLSAPEMK